MIKKIVVAIMFGIMTTIAPISAQYYGGDEEQQVQCYQCTVCGGQGVLYCSYCGGSGQTQYGDVCPACHGRGWKTCTVCMGRGQICR